MAEFRHLFSPLQIGSFTVRNRIVSTPHHTLFTDDDGLPGTREIAYWVSKARGGIGLVESHVHGIHWSIGDTFAQPAAATKFRNAAEAIHAEGAKFVGQLWHPGAQGNAAIRSPWAPSNVSHPDSWAVPHAMTVAETREVVSGYARGAAVLREAGVDGAEIHGAHGYLITQFLSPLSNKRDDEYGGDFERRMTFALEIIEAIRNEVGRDWTVGMRISGDEMTEGGYTSDDFVRMIPFLTANGQLDYLSVSVGTYRSKDTVIAPSYYPNGAFVYLSALAKEVLDIPVFCIGRINDPVMAEQILEDRQADMVGMTRANICDPELPRKAREGRLDEIRHCLGCNEGCWGHVETLRPINCAFNPSVGREEYWGDVRRTANPKRVVIAGGGPAGCEAARVAAAAGHAVTLFEAGEELGGQTLIAARAPGRSDWGEVGRYFTAELRRLGVDVRTGARATATGILALAPDHVIVATGGTPRVPDGIEGIEQPQVFQAWDVLNGRPVAGDRVLVLDDEHHIQAANAAEYLAAQDKHVQIVTREFQLGPHMEPNTRMATLRRLDAAGVTISPTTWVRAIGPGTATLYHFYSEADREEPVDAVVLACGILPETALARELAAHGVTVRSVGDCAGPRRLEMATFEGHLAAREIDGDVPRDRPLVSMPIRRG
jgi:2,4-dienoyl-CoA reductase-like NADH-dependent reductase (Old Yellow Enzyme family)/thioredoxin reductase